MSEAPALLALDTCTDVAGIAVLRGARLLSEMTWRSHQSQTTELAPRVQMVLRNTGLIAEDLGAVVVCKGPGSFNGTRGGMSFAKGLALALKLPLIGISSLEVMAYQSAHVGRTIWALLDGGRGELAVAAFRMSEQGWHRVLEEQIVSPALLADWMKPGDLICSEIPELQRASLKANTASEVVWVPEPLALRRPSVLGLLGWQRLAQGESDDVAALQPLYLRHPSITLKAEKGSSVIRN